MTARLPNNTDASFPPNAFDDPAFEPQAEFDLDDTHDKAPRNYLASFNAFNGADHGFDMMGDGSGNGAQDGGLFAGAGVPFSVGTNAFTPSQGMSSHIDLSNVRGQSTGSPIDPFGILANGARLSGVLQRAIVQKRGVGVTQQFGQIIPPEDNTLGLDNRKFSTTLKQAKLTPSAKMDKSERARNAAIQRHSKSKKAREARKDSKQDDDSDDSDGDGVGDKREKYREKNCLAAVKCRTKKKEKVEELEERHRSLKAQNNYIKS
ncbi:hypothetical protein LTR08_008840 [Meristemomyces frigidus]|nr:hypothetical protein LTR08_008840 [Meristemomyces frigidus]